MPLVVPSRFVRRVGGLRSEAMVNIASRRRVKRAIVAAIVVIGACWGGAAALGAQDPGHGEPHPAICTPPPPPPKVSGDAFVFTTYRCP